MGERIDKIKSHFYVNFNVYVAAVTGIVVGAAIGGATMCLLKYSGGNKAIIDSFNLIKYKSPHTSQTIMQVVLPHLGHPGNAVQCVETGTIYASQGQAARELGIDSATMSRIVNGLKDIPGFTIKKITEAGIPLVE